MIIDPKHPEFPAAKRTAVIGFSVGFFINMIMSVVIRKIKISAGIPQPSLTESDIFFQGIGSGIAMSVIFIIVRGIYRKIFIKNK